MRIEVLFDTTGLGIVPTQMPPNVVATASYFCSAGTTVQADWSGYPTFGPDVINFLASIRTYNAAAAVTDCSTQFHITLAAATSLVLPEPGTAGADVLGQIPARQPRHVPKRAGGSCLRGRVMTAETT